MGKIHSEVAAHHLGRFPKERDLLVPFLSCFDVTWATRHQTRNTTFSAYFLAPEQTIKDQFGIETEVLLILSAFSELQPRTMQAIDSFMKSLPAVGRVDPTTIFLVSPDPKLREWVASYAALNPQFRVTVALSHADIRAGISDPWFVRTALSDQLFSRDLFNDQLPLKSDNFFFGRTKVAAEFATSIKTGQNRGLFGLRKTGKTSLLFKIQRLARADGAKTLYYDCKDPAIRSMTWAEFLEQMIADISSEIGKRPTTHQGHVSRRFKEIVSKVSAESRLCIIFDEIEWVSPVAVIDTHWHQDFVPFWQTMWTTQSEHRQLSFIVAGVNPTVTEMPEVDGVQNPLFGIISPRFLTGLDESDVRTMLGKFGKRMGLRFDQDAILYMFERYGGHPMLTRMAGSYVNTALMAQKVKRPAAVTRNLLQNSEEERENEMMYYCPHIVSELKKFYPDEYEMLEWLATGNEADFYDFAGGGMHVSHLRDYGLLNPVAAARSKIEIPVLARYVLASRRKNEKRAEDLYVVPAEGRHRWLINRIERIGTDMRRLDKLGSSKGRPTLYGENGFPEAERFFGVKLVSDIGSLESFLNVANRCLVEPIEALGRGQAKKDYFWNEVRAGYPDIWEALLRIKVYRNDAMHAELTVKAAEQLASLRRQDFMGRDPMTITEREFLVQQKVLDGLFLSVMIEMDRML